MTLNDLVRTIESSHSSDWTVMEATTVHSWEHGVYSGEYRLIPEQHTNHAVYTPDVDISIVWGATENENFQEPWTQKYSDPSARMVHVETRYKGNTVQRSLAVYVDGSRYLLPLPEFDSQNSRYVVKQDDLDFGRLLFELYGPGGSAQTIEDAFSWADVEVV
jgi:hypothetical protein